MKDSCLLIHYARTLLKQKGCMLVSNTVLIVDDDDLNREVMEAFLSLDGYDVFIAGNGRKALELAESQLPDLMILDLRLPDLNGFEICKSLRANPKTQHILVMMITGFSDPKVRQQALSVGVDVFFPRPFDGDDFTTEVKRLLQYQN